MFLFGIMLVVYTTWYVTFYCEEGFLMVCNDRVTGACKLTVPPILVFQGIPDAFLSEMEEDICGLDSTTSHPLKGAEYVVVFDDTGEGNSMILLFRGELESVVEAYAHWHMRDAYRIYENGRTKSQLDAALGVTTVTD